jgi:glycosyltransferase involved in cell wall biosynthesis
MNKMQKISAVIIAFNEERNIERCLVSLERVADEIVVVDSFSSDSTSEICARHGVRFIQNAFKGHIEQKNFALGQAKFEIVLSLDADEALSPELERSILTVKKDFKYDGYCFNRLNNYYGKWIRYTSRYPDRKLRLWKKSMGSWGGTNPHDKVIMRKGSRVSFLKGNLDHYAYATISEHVSQANKFTDIAALAYYRKGISGGYIKIIVHPLWKFFREYIVRGGFIDGYHGLVISAVISFETFLKYVKLKKLYRDKEKTG